MTTRWQATRAPREVMRQVGGVVCLIQCRTRILHEHIEIFSLLSVRSLANAHVAIEQRTTVIGPKQPLVRVHDETVDLFDANK